VLLVAHKKAKPTVISLFFSDNKARHESGGLFVWHFCNDRRATEGGVVWRFA
jgi:hypothetical protein